MTKIVLLIPADVTMTEVTLNQEDHSYMFDDDSTPVKACSELGYHVTTGWNQVLSYFLIFSDVYFHDGF